MSGRFARVIVAILSALMLAAIVCAGYLFGRYDELDVRTRLAAGQTTSFESVREKALQSTRPEEIAACIEHTLDYYPSGSGQPTGSRLDHIVEGVRRTAVDDMIRHLRAVSGIDLGDDPQKWIEKFRKPKGQQGGAANAASPHR
jgi:hypothetical protein